MEEPVENMKNALSSLIELLNSSEESIYARETPGELLKVVETNLASIKQTGSLLNPETFSEIFLPTASLQEIAIDNGWGPQYLELAKCFETK